MNTRRHSTWLALLVCLSVLSLIVHLNNRFSHESFHHLNNQKSGVAWAQWQYLDRTAMQAAAPVARATLLLPIVIGQHIQIHEFLVSHTPLSRDLFSRPPPSC